MAYARLARAFSVALRIGHWLRPGRTEQPPLVEMTDEVERALAGERPTSPYHRFRYSK